MRTLHPTITVAITAFAFGMTVQAADIYVSPDATTAAPYDSWANGFNTVQDALDHADPGDTIYVAGRTFTLAATLSLTNAAITMIGGFEATNPADQPGIPNPEQWPTVFTRTFRVVLISGASNTRLENVRITGGTTHTGGGIQVNNSTGVELINCVIDNNRFSASATSTLRGAGLFINSGSSVTMIGCRVENNAAVNTRVHATGARGGGIWCEGALVIRDSQILNNVTDSGQANNLNTLGGGIFFQGSSLVMTNVLMAGNYAYTGGSGLHIAGGAASLQNVTIADNFMDGIDLAAGTLAFTDGIAWGNGLDIDDQTASGLTVSFSNVGDIDYGGNNISANPLFEYGYYLTDGSLCVNAGSGTAAGLGLENYAKNTGGDTYGGAETVNLGYHYPTGFDLTYADIYVATDGDDSGSGTDESEPFATLTNALAMARAGSRIHVATGTYNIASGEVFPLVFPAHTGVQILGASSEDTIIDASASGRVLSMTYTHRALLKNLTITGGRRTPNHGAGLSIINSYGVTLESCIIADNQYSVSASGNLHYGGGIYAYQSDLTLTNSIIRDNTMANTHGSGPSRGAGLWSNGSITIRDSQFTGNAGSSGCGGGAIYFEGITLNMKNVLFNGNSTDAGGAGIAVGSGAVHLENCTIANNIGEGIRQSGGSVSVINSILWNNGVDSTGTVSIAWSDIGNSSDYTDDGDNLSANPLFEMGYYLAAGSPCINAGSDTAVELGMNGYAKNFAGDAYGPAETVNLGYHYAADGEASEAPEDLYVAIGGDNGNHGTNAASPFATLTHALTQAGTGTRIHIGPGSYTTATGEVFPIAMSGLVGVQILGDENGGTVLDAFGANARVMTMSSATQPLLRNLTLTGGRRTPDHGAGLLINQSQGVLLESCTISNNQYTISSSGNFHNGGGIYATLSEVSLSNCVITANYLANTHGSGPSRGTAIWSDGTLTILNSIISNNEGGTTGSRGTIYFEGTELVMRNVLLYGNSTTDGGGAVAVAQGTANIDNCTVFDNSDEGIRRYGGSVLVRNGILWNNGIDSTGTVTIAYSMIENSTDYTDGGENLSDDPLFVDASAGNYRLQPGSPAIDSGSNQAWMIGATDLDGIQRVMKGIVDRGCYELTPPLGSLILFK